MMVETKPGHWVKARDIYFTLSIKANAYMVKYNHQVYEFFIKVKSIEFSMFKILRNDEEMELE